MVTLPPARKPVVLVADDDPSARDFVARVLSDHGIVVETVEDGQKALTRALTGSVDLVLLDVVMPDLGGMECCRLLKSGTREGFLPVILLTVRNDTESRIEGLRIGADDYVGKPFDERELVERVGGLLRIKHMHDELIDAKTKLEQLAINDELTGLYNYRYLHTRLTDEFRRAERYNLALGCVMVDVDRFKQVNDSFGHDAGDSVLRQVAKRMLTCVRTVDMVARYGGEEFVVLLPHTAAPGAVRAAERIRIAVSEKPIDVGKASCNVTVSAGVAVWPAPTITSRDNLLKAADRALYRAKAEGRNRTYAANFR